MKKISILLCFISIIFIIFFLNCQQPSSGSSGGDDDKETKPESNVLFSENFEGFSEGTQLPGPPWTDYTGTNINIPGYSIIIEGGSKTLRMATGGRIFYNGGNSWANYTFSLRLKINPIHQFGIQLRKQAGTYAGYQVDLAGGTQLNLSWSEENGTSHLLDQIAIAYSEDTYYTLKVIVNGNNIKVYFNNSAIPQIDLNDAHYTNGTIGLFASNSTPFFDDILITKM